MAITLAVPSFAQSNVSHANSLSGVRRSLATIMLAGIGGAVLGMSTLSFHGQPQAHIGNITTGLALGVIAGAGFVTYQSSQRPTFAEAPWESSLATQASLGSRGVTAVPLFASFGFSF